MPLLLSLLILAAGPTVPSQARHPDSVEVFHCGFEESSDADYDAWPDRWTRQHGTGFPRYLPIKIVGAEGAEGRNALRMELNGGAAALRSPRVPVGHLFSYAIEARLKTEGLHNSRAFVSLTFYDEHDKPLGTLCSEKYATLPQWTKISVSPLVPPGEAVASASIGLHLEPADATVSPDLRGAAMFDDVWLGRLPRMSLSLKGGSHVFTDPKEVEVTCAVSGIFERDPIMKFELVDVSSRSVARLEHRLEGEVIAQKSSRASDLLGEGITHVSGFTGSTDWRPDITEPGYYRVRVTMQGRTGMILQRQASLVLLEPRSAPKRGEFGWTLPRGDQPLPLPALAQLLPNMGVNWVKFPVWVSDKQAGRLDQLAAFAERLSGQGVEMVGLLSEPPAEVRSQLAEGGRFDAAAIFAAKPDLWYPSLEPVMTQLSLQVRWWQLGLDDDASFVGNPELVKTIAGVKQQIQRFGQEVNLGIGWRMINEPPPDARPPWEFLALSADPPLNQDELAVYLPAIDGRHTRRWVDVEPLPRSQYTIETRASDLIHRLLAAKIHEAEGIFIPNPFSTERGLMNDDGTPGELLLSWRTTALALAGARHVGSLVLPQGSQNHLFERDGEMVMVVWNAKPVQETLFLGENLRQTDIWGRSTEPARQKHEHVLSVGPLPSFITGIEPAVARINLGVAFEKTRLPSLFGVSHENLCVVRNSFSQGVGGQIRLVTPESWKTYPRVIDFKSAAGEEMRLPFSVTLPFDAGSGRQPVRLDFDVNADHRYQFSVYRYLDVGLGDVTIDAATHLNQRGELEVEQRIANQTSELVSFKCLLFVPERRRMVSQVVKLGPQRDVKTYRLSNGRELVGKTLWLRAEEVGGQRILNLRFVATE